jgi:putative polyketide hydroxylase
MMTRASRPRIPVLIVGAGLAGLTAAALLAWRGVPCLLVERRARASQHPRARGVNPRSMELLRGIPGLEAELAAAGRPGSDDLSIVIAESVTGREFRTVVAPGQTDFSVFSPARPCTAGQDRVEPILLRHARAVGADIRLSAELVRCTQNGDGVRATVRDRITGNEAEISADYMVAADGTRSSVRQMLGIDTHGLGTLSHNISILFEADLEAVLRGRGFVLYYLRNPGFTGVFVTTDDPNRGQVSVEYDPTRESPADYHPAHAAEMVRLALGLPDLDVRILDVMGWEMSSRIADRMSVGRVFLAGDAAHTMPPTGGLGGQTAIQDAADLAWKIAMVLQGHAGRALLDTYEAERRPVAELSVGRQTANYVERLRPDRTELSNGDSEADYLSVAMGYRYRSAAILEETPDDGQPTENPLHPTGRPGTRLTHLPLCRDGRQPSTLDLIGRDFVLFAGPDGSSWIAATRDLAERARLPITALRINEDVVAGAETLMAKTGIDPSGAVLVRPDGFIAWRARSTPTGDSVAKLAAALGDALCRDLSIHDRPA